jgi:hypothetical protein
MRSLKRYYSQIAQKGSTTILKRRVSTITWPQLSAKALFEYVASNQRKPKKVSKSSTSEPQRLSDMDSQLNTSIPCMPHWAAPVPQKMKEKNSVITEGLTNFSQCSPIGQI